MWKTARQAASDGNQRLDQSNTGINVLNPFVRLFLVDNLLGSSYCLHSGSFLFGLMSHSISVIPIGEPPTNFN